MTHRLWYGSGKFVLLTGAVLGALVGVVGLFDSLHAAGLVGSWAVTEERLREVALWVSLISVVPPLVLGGLASAARALTGFTAGRELAFSPNLQVNVATSPDFICAQRTTGGRNVTVATLSRRGRPMPHIRHSIYDDPAVFAPISAWLGDAFEKTILDFHVLR